MSSHDLVGVVWTKTYVVVDRAVEMLLFRWACLGGDGLKDLKWSRRLVARSDGSGREVVGDG